MGSASAQRLCVMVTPMVGLLVDYGRGVVVVKRPTVDTERWGVCAQHSGPFIFLLKSSKRRIREFLYSASITPMWAMTGSADASTKSIACFSSAVHTLCSGSAAIRSFNSLHT